MRAIRLVVSDVDGTLVDKEKQVTPATVDAVARLRAAGVGFAIISARPRPGLLPILDTLGLDGDAGAYNGGLVFRRCGAVAFHEAIDAEVARGVWELAKDWDVGRWLFVGDAWHAQDLHGPHTESERITANQAPSAIDDPDTLLAKVDKITFVSDDEPLLRRLADEAKAAFEEAATVAQSQPYYLDVTARSADKGQGIARLAEAYGVALDEIAAIGDQANDLPMLTRAGLAIAMGNAPDHVQAAAHHVTAGNDADGVAQAIDRFILKGVSA